MTEIDKYRENACKKLELIISYLGVTAKVSSSDNAGKKLKLKVESEDAGRIIGRRGRTLASIQLLLNSAMHQSDDPLPEIIIEIEGYDRHKREEEGKGRRRNPKRDRNDKSRGGRNDRDQKDQDSDDENDRNKSRRRNSQKADENRGEDKRTSKPKPKSKFTKEDSEYFVNPDEMNTSEDEDASTVAPGEAVEQTETQKKAPADAVTDKPKDAVAPPTKESAAPADESAKAPSDESAKAPSDESAKAPAAESAKAPAAESAKAPADESAKASAAEPTKKPSGEQLPDNVIQCRQKALDAAKEVRRWGEEIMLRGMTGEERKAIKEALSDDPLIDVVEGEVTGPDKRKIIIRERSMEKALKD